MGIVACNQDYWTGWGGNFTSFWGVANSAGNGGQIPHGGGTVISVGKGCNEVGYLTFLCFSIYSQYGNCGPHAIQGYFYQEAT